MDHPSGIDCGIWERIRQCLAEIEAARSQDDPQALAEKLARRAQVFRSRTAEAMPVGPQVTFLAFNKGGERYAIPIEDVVEVQALDQFTPVPGVPAFLRGVVQFRGVIVSLLDLGRLLEIPEGGLADLHAFIVIDAGGRRFALIASQAEEIDCIPTHAIKRAPDLAGNAPPEWIAGIYDENRIIVRPAQLVNDARLLQWRKAGISGSLRSETTQNSGGFIR